MGDDYEQDELDRFAASSFGAGLGLIAGAAQNPHQEEAMRRERRATLSRAAVNRIRPKGEEARHAIGIVLQALECEVSIVALERAVATVKAHLEAAA